MGAEGSVYQHRLQVIHAEQSETLTVLERWQRPICRGCTTTPPAAPAALRPCTTCRGWLR